MLQMAEEQKTSVRSKITGLRHQFQALLQRNNQLPEHLRLNRKVYFLITENIIFSRNFLVSDKMHSINSLLFIQEFELDAEIKEELERQKREKISVVLKEMAWEEEKYRIALDKIRSR